MKKTHIAFLGAALSFISFQNLLSNDDNNNNHSKKIRIENISFGAHGGGEGYKFLLVITERKPDGSLITYQRTLEPLLAKNREEATFWDTDYFEADRKNIVSIGIKRYGDVSGIGAKIKFIPQELLIKNPEQDLTIAIDYSIGKQLGKTLFGWTGLVTTGGTSIYDKFGPLDPIPFPEFGEAQGWFSKLKGAFAAWWESPYNYFPQAKKFKQTATFAGFRNPPARYVLGVPSNPTLDDIDNAYESLMKKWNPSNFEDPNQKYFAHKMTEYIEAAYRSLGGQKKIETENPTPQESVQEYQFEQVAPVSSEAQPQITPEEQKEIQKDANKNADLLADIFAAARAEPSEEELQHEAEQKRLLEASISASEGLKKLLETSAQKGKE